MSGLVVNQGDLLHGDGNGVTSIPLEIASEVPDVATGLVAAEKIVLDYVRLEEQKASRGAGRKDRLGDAGIRAAAAESFAAVTREIGPFTRRDGWHAVTTRSVALGMCPSATDMPTLHGFAE